ncbi:hypothetical protein DFH28DRAFT_1081844 [Melampsora americana]|nr:hypothetical protein DFH28DRAFT_1081844 [Melampsora americana]
MATVILIKLVQSDKYSGVSADDLDAKKVFQLIISHIKGTCFEILTNSNICSCSYCEQHQWSHQQLEACNKRKNQQGRVNMREGRLAYIMSHKLLCTLDPVVQNSIDEVQMQNNSIKLLPGVKPRIRTCHNNPMINLFLPDDIHKDYIFQSYIDQLDPLEKANIKIINKSILQDVKEMINEKLLPHK